MPLNITRNGNGTPSNTYDDVVDNLEKVAVFCEGLEDGTPESKLDASNLDQATLGVKFTYEKFAGQPVCIPAAGYGTPSGTAQTANTLHTPNAVFEYAALGTQTIVAPVYVTASGLNIAMDQTDNDGVELTQGITSRSRSAFTIGTDAFFLEVKFSIGDVTGTDDCAWGFRKTAAYNAAIDAYTDMATLNVISGNISIETILNDGSTTTTDTTLNWADGESHTLRVEVSATGAVTYKVDGETPPTVAAFTFDSGDIVVPFGFFLNAADLVDTLYIDYWKCGLQSLE